MGLGYQRLVRTDLLGALTAALERLASPGTWFTAQERLALARATRQSHEQALSLGMLARSEPGDVPGGSLPAGAIAAARRIVLDPGNLSRGWYEELVREGLTAEQYVEVVGVVATMCQLDYFSTALGFPRVAFPEPKAGSPTRARPEGAETSVAWVPMVPPERATGELADFYKAVEYVPYIIMTMSLVPAENIAFFSTHAHMYVPDAQDLKFHRSISRPQMERLAITVSTLTSCLYCRESHESLMDGVRNVWGKEPVEHEDLLVRYASSLTRFEAAELAVVREELWDSIGWVGLVDAAAVAAAFNAINRVANATGVSLDPIFHRE